VHRAELISRHGFLFCAVMSGVAQKNVHLRVGQIIAPAVTGIVSAS
jgi:hypothetical protein